MNKTELKSLVKEYFNLVDAPEATETKETFGQVETADGSLTLHFPGDKIEIGTPLTFIDEEGNSIPAPAGEHMLADDQRVVLDEEGRVTEFLTAEPAAEAESEEELASCDTDMAEHGDEEEEMGDYEDKQEMEDIIEEVIEEAIEEVAMEEHEEEAPMLDAKEIIEAVTEAVMEEMRKEIEAMKAEMSKEVETFKKAPASTKTITPTRRAEELKEQVTANVFNKARWESVLNRVKK